MDITRRNALKIIGATPVAAGLGGLGDASAEQAAHQQHATQAGQQAAERKGPYKPKFFTPHEWATVVLLADIILPKDGRSGSASEAGAPEFIDFMMIDRPDGQVPMRGGLRWLDSECNTRFGKTFLTCAEAERTQVLDDIAYPRKASAEFSHGVAFFSRFRDMVATGFWTSKIGIEDLQYMGNRPTTWDGCPDACLTHLGVKA
jgi:gluconate 2-dehydrogenase gamma chain